LLLKNCPSYPIFFQIWQTKPNKKFPSYKPIFQNTTQSLLVDKVKSLEPDDEVYLGLSVSWLETELSGVTQHSVVVLVIWSQHVFVWWISEDCQVLATRQPYWGQPTPKK
jgi:hypothetical protein